MQPLFTPVPWISRASLYEVNLRQYTAEGTFQAFSKELPRLRDMGIDTLWFMPITPISVEKRHGSLGSYYACSSYTDTNPEFGTVKDFSSFVKQAHSLGFKVIIDWVANHTGADHEWIRSNPGFYKRNTKGDFYDNNGWDDVIDLNYYDQAMRHAMIAAMQFWIDTCDIDGFRCDMAHLVPLDFWRQARLHLDTVKPLFWLAETEHINYRQVFDCSYAWHWMHQSEKFIRGDCGVDEIRQTLFGYLASNASSAHLFFTANHDENSWNGTEYEKYGKAAACFAVLCCTWNGIPLVYSGQELPNFKRLKFFDKDPIEWTGKYELHDFYKTLLTLRSRHPALQTLSIAGSRTAFVQATADPRVIAYRRTHNERQVVVLLNFTGMPQPVNVDDTEISGEYKNAFTGVGIHLASQNHFMLEPWGFLVLEK